MSVWKKIESDVLKENVNRELFMKTLKGMDIGLDNSVKKIANSYGTDTCDAALVKNGRVTTLGIRFTKKGGVELVGDIWNTGLGEDSTQELFMDTIAHNYQVNNIKKQLEYTNWIVDKEEIKNGKTVLELIQY